jgi:5-dehydro-2-deoxygluconokinase
MMPERNELFVLPFDHRGSFMEEMFGVTGKPSKEDMDKVRFYKGMIYGGFKIAMLHGIVPKRSAAILADEEFSDEVLCDAKNNGFRTCVCAEKSGQKEFELEYGQDFREHIRRYRPDYVKALIRYNPEEDKELNERQIERLKVLSDFCREEDFKLMLEPLVPPTEEQLLNVNGDRDAYDQMMRPHLMEEMMEELQQGGVEPSIWKIEGLDERSDYKMLAEQARADGRNADIIVLGRHASEEQVQRWLDAARGLDGVVGFAIGRTIFWEPLTEYKAGRVDASEAMEKIARNYEHYYEVFKGE